MRWLIDGYNVIRRDPELAAREAESLARSGAAVVSSDRKVQDAARRAGCPVLGADQFLEALDGAEPGRPSEAANDDRDSGYDDASSKRGNPRRSSKKARRAQRALRRLREP